MKIFLDTANLDELRDAAAFGVVDGVTTNPSLIAREGRSNADQIRAICDVIDGDISAEVVSTQAEEMIREGRELAAIHSNVVVKCPLIPEGIKATKVLSSEGIRVNVTLCFTASQALLAAKAGAYIISPFMGRIDDLSSDGTELIREIVAIYENYDFPTQVLAASIRGPLQVKDVALTGSHIATMPAKVFHQLFKHPLTDIGLEQFLADYRKTLSEVSVG